VPNNCNFVSTHHIVRKYAGHRQDVRMLGSGRAGPSAFVSKVCEQRERAAADVRQMLDLDKLCCGWYSRSPTSRVMLSVVLAGGGTDPSSLVQRGEWHHRQVVVVWAGS